MKERIIKRTCELMRARADHVTKERHPTADHPALHQPLVQPEPRPVRVKVSSNGATFFANSLKGGSKSSDAGTIASGSKAAR